MNDKQELYDELCRVLTDFEGNGSEEGATPADLYSVLVKIQNSWEGIITADTDVPAGLPGIEELLSTIDPSKATLFHARGILLDWLSGTGPYAIKTGGYYNTLMRVRKNADFDYLYIQRQYHVDSIKRKDDFEYAGIFCKRDGLVYDVQYSVRALFDEQKDQNMRGSESLFEQLKADVRSSVEATIANDRDNLRIIELSSEEEIKMLEDFKSYYANERARTAYLGNDSDDDFESCVGYEFEFRCNYRPEQWTEESFLAYILDPAGYVSSEAKEYIDSHQEHMLSEFLAGDMIAEEYEAIIKNPTNPVHFVKRIMGAMAVSSAKTVTVTIHKNDIDFTFKTEADSLRLDCKNTYSDYRIVAADRREFQNLFGRSAEYGPEDIVRIEYSRSVLYKKEDIHE